MSSRRRSIRRAKPIFILDRMLETLSQRRPDLSKWAPRITQIKVKPDQIRLIIGPGGKTIGGIIDQTGVAIDVADEGTVNMASSDSDAVKQALDIIKGLTTEPEVGAVYKGTVRRVADFGAFRSRSFRGPTACSTSPRWPTTASTRLPT